jgi:hypothetical protein
MHNWDIVTPLVLGKPRTLQQLSQNLGGNEGIGPCLRPSSPQTQRNDGTITENPGSGYSHFLIVPEEPSGRFQTVSRHFSARRTNELQPPVNLDLAAG